VVTGSNEGAPDAPVLAEEQRLGGLSVDWWAVIAAGVFVVLAVADVLPRIPW
jgi:hypothetical protein